MRLPRWMHQLYALVGGYFWLPCPRCGRMFGGHERHGVGVPTGEPGLFRVTCGRCDA